jgi:hypothetical protein
MTSLNTACQGNGLQAGMLMFTTYRPLHTVRSLRSSKLLMTSIQSPQASSHGRKDPKQEPCLPCQKLCSKVAEYCSEQTRECSVVLALAHTVLVALAVVAGVASRALLGHAVACDKARARSVCSCSPVLRLQRIAMTYTH